MNERIFYSEYFYQKGSKDTDVLEKNARTYPYSSLAAFLLLYHYKKTANSGFEKLAKKTALLFNNPHWLQFQLYDKSSRNPEEEIISNEDFPEEKEIVAEEKNDFPLEISPVENVIENETKETEVKEDEVPHIADHETKSDIIPEILHQENSLKGNEIKENFEETATSSSIHQNEFTENKNMVNEDEIIAFEPLHTVDYFASQGIKINEELLTKDKLGSQMKSFTAWLKSMKKLHPGKLEEQSPVTEKLIQTSAEASNINTEVLTEAMAEVLIKQDKKEKAIEMFSKLSLINPSKSAYFAARIESIKSN
jgi:hypothetical protein